MKTIGICLLLVASAAADVYLSANQVSIFWLRALLKRYETQNLDIYRAITLMTLLRIPFLGQIGSISYVLPIRQNIDILNRDIRVSLFLSICFPAKNNIETPYLQIIWVTYLIKIHLMVKLKHEQQSNLEYIKIERPFLNHSSCYLNWNQK